MPASLLSIVTHVPDGHAVWEENMLKQEMLREREG